MLLHSIDFIHIWIGKINDIALSKKIEFLVLFTVYFVSEIYMRGYGIAHGNSMCQLILDLRHLKDKVHATSENDTYSDSIIKMKRIFTFGTLTAVTLQLIHIPIRVSEWYYNHPVGSSGYLILPNNPAIQYPLIFFSESGGIVCRSFTLALIIFTGLDLYEIYSRIVHRHIRSHQPTNIETNSKTIQTDCMNLLLHSQKNGAKIDRLLQQDNHLQQFSNMKGCFNEYNRIVGSYTSVILAWSMGTLSIEIMSLSSMHENSNGTLNNVAGIFGTVFGLLVIYLITLLGHKLENKVNQILYVFII
jgi:hypothetical protein